MSDAAFNRFVDVMEQIANNGINVYVHVGDDKMALDLAAMKIGESLEQIATAITESSSEQ